MRKIKILSFLLAFILIFGTLGNTVSAYAYKPHTPINKQNEKNYNEV